MNSSQCYSAAGHVPEKRTTHKKAEIAVEALSSALLRKGHPFEDAQGLVQLARQLHRITKPLSGSGQGF